MAGSVAGGKKAAKTNRTKTKVYLNGRLQEIEPGTMYAVIGRAGGKLGKTGGFYADRERAREAGRKGGKVTKDNYKNQIFKVDNTEFDEGFNSPSWIDKLMRRSK